MGRTASPVLPAALVIALAHLTAGCGSSTSTATGLSAPSSLRCQLSLSGSSASFGPGGGTGTLNVGVSRECSWSAASQASWIELTSAREGQGDGTITFRVRENGDPVTRRGSIAVGEQRLDVSQEAAPCRFDLQLPVGDVPSAGGQLAVPIATHGVCRWTAASDVFWVTLAPTAGTGPAAVQVTIQPNTGAARFANITIAGQGVAVTQAAAAAPPPPAPTPNPPPSPPTPPGQPVPPTQPAPGQCSYTLSPSGRSFSAETGTGSVSVTTGAGCTWTAVSSVPWAVVTSGISGSGSGEIRYLVAANSTTSIREGVITAGGQSHRVTQAAGTRTTGPSVDLDGPVSGLAGSCPALQFTVRGETVFTDASTKFDGGKCRDLRNGLKIEVKGVRQPDDRVYAREVEMDD